MKKEYLEAGKIVTTHGIRGEVKIMPYTDSPELLAEFDRLFIGKNHEEVFIERSRVFKNTVIAKIEGIDTPEAARSSATRCSICTATIWSLTRTPTSYRTS